MDSTARGGSRPGAGRKHGSHDRFSKEDREQAKATGLLPHEILLDIARGNPQPRYEADEEGNLKRIGWEVPTREDIKECAKAAAPYYAPKISTVEVVGNMGDDELDQDHCGPCHRSRH
jgi:hypothetical protein